MATHSVVLVAVDMRAALCVYLQRVQEYTCVCAHVRTRVQICALMRLLAWTAQ
jgi:hypothetical protein